MTDWSPPIRWAKGFLSRSRGGTGHRAVTVDREGRVMREQFAVPNIPDEDKVGEAAAIAACWAAWSSDPDEPS